MLRLLIFMFLSTTASAHKDKVYRGKNLYSLGNSYTEPFWQKSGIMIITPQEQAIIKQLEQTAKKQ